MIIYRFVLPCHNFQSQFFIQRFFWSHYTSIIPNFELSRNFLAKVKQTRQINEKKNIRNVEEKISNEFSFLQNMKIKINKENNLKSCKQ